MPDGIPTPTIITAVIHFATPTLLATDTPTSTEISLIPTPVPTRELPGNYDAVNLADLARLVSIPGGEFLMGVDPSRVMALCESLGLPCEVSDFEDEHPVHVVTLATYQIYQFEVTNAQYRLCVEAGACSPPAFGEFFNDVRFAEHPVVFVNWLAASAYCTWIGGRLPTEAEWEYAASGTDERLFPWGEDAACGYGNYDGCTRGLTTEVGSYPEGASPFGVFDMGGNVTEWVGDWYAPNYYSRSAELNPTGPEEGELKAARGGSWKNPLLGVRTTDRTANFPEVYSSGTGFRCVIPLGE